MLHLVSGPASLGDSFNAMSGQLRNTELCDRDYITGGPFEAATVSPRSDAETMGEQRESAAKKIPRLLTTPEALSLADSMPATIPSPLTLDKISKRVFRNGPSRAFLLPMPVRPHGTMPRPHPNALNNDSDARPVVEPVARGRWWRR